MELIIFIMAAIQQNQDSWKTPSLSQPQEVEADSIQRLGDQVTQYDLIRLEQDELPLNWPASKKWTITILVAFISGTVTFASSVHASAVGM